MADTSLKSNSLEVLGSRISSPFAVLKGHENVANAVTCSLAPLGQYNDEDLKSDHLHENGIQIKSTEDFCLSFGSIKLLLL